MLAVADGTFLHRLAHYAVVNDQQEYLQAVSA
jgi:hypothetical protein